MPLRTPIVDVMGEFTDRYNKQMYDIVENCRAKYRKETV